MTLRGAGIRGDLLQVVWGGVSYSQQYPGGLSLLESPLALQDHPSLGPQGDRGHPKRKGKVMSHSHSPELCSDL